MRKPLILMNCDVEIREKGGDRVHISENYIRAVADYGGVPLVAPATMEAGVLRAAAALCDGFLFIGGADVPPAMYGEEVGPLTRPMNSIRGDADKVLIEAVLARDIPILGVCGGHQLLNVGLGGKLIQHIANAEDHMHQPEKGDELHYISIKGGRVMRGLFGEARIEVNSAHHQAIDPEHLGRGLEIVARADDGTVEAVEGRDPGRFVLGVQWHPERHRDLEQRKRIFEAFLGAASEVGR